MFRRTVSGIILALLLTNMLTLAFNIQPVSADGIIYIRADGSVDPPTAPILRNGNIYTFVGNINGSIVVEKSSVVVDGNGYALQGYGYGDGFLLRGLSWVTIQNVNIKGFLYGIYMNLSSYNTISANFITDSKYGLYLYNSQNNTVSGNTLERNYRYGIYMYYHSSFNVFRNNRMANNTYNFYEQALPHFRNNVDTSNTVDGKPIYYWINKRDMTIPSDAGYVALINCTRINVANLNLRGNGDGVLLVDSMNIVVSGNTITDSVFGIRDWSLEIESKSNNMRDNEITRCLSGIDMQYSSNNTLRNNHMRYNSGSLYLYGEDRSYFAHDIDTSNTVDGRPVYYWVNRKDCELPLNAGYVGLVGSTNITVRDLDLKNSGQLLLAYTNDSLIENNRIIDGFDGISMISSHGNTILGNSIVSNDYTIYAYSSTGNLVYHNDFVNNTRPPDFRRSSPAVWDNGYPSGGNYWSDYNGTDFYSGPNQNVAGSDSIGDTPYIIGVNNTDRYPLMNPWNMRADSFRFPIDGLWTVRQRFGGYNYDWNDYHLGEDVLRSFEAPVFAPADGVVKHNAKRTGYGYVVIIEHQLMDGTFVCSVLGHLREAGRVSVGATVTKGQIVGYLSSVPEENGGIIHLHFGIRKGVYSEELDFDGKWRYRGYGPIDIVGSWCPPSAFIEYYNENKEMPPSYSLTLNTEGGGAFTASSASVCTLVYNTVLTLISSHPWWQRWSGTDRDNINPTTVTMDSIRNVIAHLCEYPVPSFVWPVPSVVKEDLTSDYGRYVWSDKYGEYRYHTGIDITASVPDTPVVAVATGKIVEIVSAETNHTHQMENVVVIEHNLPVGHVSGKTKVYTLYAHMVSIRDGLKVGDDVPGGYEIGKIYGTIDRKSPYESGTITRKHLHFEVKDEPTLGRSWTILGPAWIEEGWAHLYLHNPKGYPYGSTTQYWGYTRYHPDNCGYHDPMLFFHTTRNIDPTIIRVNTDTLNVRRGPSTEYRTQTTVQLGQEFMALKKSSETTGDWYQIWRREFQIGRRGSGLLEDTADGWVSAAYVEVQTQMKVTNKCPTDLIVVDPDGITITKDEDEVPGMFYMELDINGDGEPDDMVCVPEPKAGDYLITVIPEPGAPPTGNFTLEASANGTTILLADHALISEIPTDPYIITRNESAIMLRNVNVAATNVTLIKGVVGQGYSSSINVTVQNQGNLEETFNFTVYANATPIALQAVTLTSGNSTTITFSGNTTGLAYGNYTISAYAEPVLDETYVADNNVTCIVPVHVGVPGDVSSSVPGVYDKKCDMKDVAYLVILFNTKPNSSNWNPNADVDNNAVVNMIDIAIAILNFNKHE